MRLITTKKSPVLRFKDDLGEEYSEWEYQPFIDVFEALVTRNHQIKTRDVLTKGLFPVVDQGQSQIAGFSNESEKLIEVHQGVIVYGDHTTTVKFIDFQFIVGADGTKVLSSKKGDNIKYLYYCLTFSNVPSEGYKRHYSIVKQLRIPVPSCEEQQKIADFLSSVDTRIEQLEKKKSLLEQFKKGLMQKLFSQEIRFKDDQGEEYPEWEIKFIGDISEVKRGASPRPITSPKWFDENSKIGWVRISDVTRSNRYLTKTMQYLSNEGVKQSRLLSKGSIVMSICATIGKPIYINFDVCIHDGFVVFENLKVKKEYLYYFLEKIQKRWYRYGQPGTQVNLNTGIVSREVIQIPTQPEQQKIANFLSSIDKNVELIAKQIEHTREFKRGLLHQMFV